MDPRSLPIYDIAQDVALRLSTGNRLVLEAPTGSGKSTQVPQILLDHQLLASDQTIAVLQPRRVAARMLARRVASERRSKVGHEIGYQIRFDNQTSRDTRVAYVTEGVLLRKMLTDPTLPGTGAILFDEFHERHFYGDITLARARQIQETHRPDLKLMVMSATLDGEAVATYLDHAPRLTSQGKTFPVDITYHPQRDRHKGQLWDHIARVLQTKYKESPPLATLIFLPGAFEIRKTLETLRRASWAKGIDLLPLHGDLPPAEQDRAVSPSHRPRIIAATNIAETSLTIPDVTLVIDSGLARLADFDPRRGINTLTIQKISRASADQRAGRAGRTAPGVCVRLWSEKDHHARPAQTSPEIHRMDLAEAILGLYRSGIQDLETFPWFEAPEAKALQRAHALLLDLGALEKPGSRYAITPLGEAMVRYPLPPRYSRILEEAQRCGCAEAMSELVALAQGRPIFAGKKGSPQPDTFVYGNEVSDFQPALRALGTARDLSFRRESCEQSGIHAQAAREADRLARSLHRSGRPDTEHLTDNLVSRCLLTGFPDQVARRKSMAHRTCDLVGGRSGQLSEHSLINDAPLFLTTEVTEIEGKDLQVLLSGNTALTHDLLQELAPHAIARGASADWDPRERRVIALEATRYHDLVLDSKPAKDPPESLAAEILARQVLEGNLILKHWNRSVDQWIARLHLLAETFPE
ncbi:MAG: helicase-related protein, partial [Verrucomicrobiota bacterium]